MSAWAPRVLVTGGAGYVGSHACKALAGAGYTPITYDNLSTGNRWAVQWGPLEVGDILDAARLNQVFEACEPVAVLHFAAVALVGESMRKPARYYRNNVFGTINILDACRRQGVSTFVFSSTCAVYGIPDRLPISEDSPTNPVNPYGASKLMVERILADYAMAYGINYAALRYFNAAGADPDGEIGECRAIETHLVPLALDAVLGRRGPLQIMGDDYPTPDGTAIRDYVHVSDLADAHLAALAHLRDGGASLSCNLGTGHGHSVRELLAAVIGATGLPVPCSSAPRRPGDPPVLVADPSGAAESLAWLPRFSSLETIIDTAWRWHGNRPEPAAALGQLRGPGATAAGEARC